MLHQQTILDMLNAPTRKKLPSFVPKIPAQLYDRFLCSLCFDPSLKGYPYIKQALYHEYLNQHSLPALHKDIYREIATLYHTQIAAVERCISFSIKKAYQNNPDGFHKLFPNDKKQPSNFRFLKTVALHIICPDQEP